MPRSSSGTYSLPIAAFVPGGVIKSSDHNSNYSDIATALTQSLATTGVSQMTGPIKAFQGAVGSPSYSFASSATTGLYLAGSNQIGWVANGVTGATFNSDLSVTWSGAQSITGGITVTGGVSSGGVLSGTAVSVSGTCLIGGNLGVAGAAGVVGNLAVGGAAAVSGKFSTLSTDSMAIANGTSAQRNVAPSPGDVRYNSTLGSLEFFNGSWVQTISFGNSSATGLVVKNNAGTPNTKIDVTALQAFMVNSVGVGSYSSSISVTIDLTVSGVNGLDTGSIVSSNWYHIYLISNGAITAGLASLSSTAPTLPTGYVFALRVGAMLTDSSSHLYRTIQRGSCGAYVITPATNTATFPFLSDTGGTSTWTAYAVGGVSIPSTSTGVNLVAGSNYNSQSSGTMGVAPNGSYATPSTSATGNPSYLSSAVGNGNNSKTYPLTIILETNSIYVWGTSTNDKVFVSGWRDAVNAC